MSTADRAPNAAARSTAAPQLGALARFAATGLVSSAAYGGLFLLLGAVTDLPLVSISILSTIVSTALSNELHRRFTFRSTAPGAVTRGQIAGAGMALIGLVANSLTVAGWSAFSPNSSPLASLVVVYCMTGIIGIGNFLVMRRVLLSRAPGRGRRPADAFAATAQRAALG